MYCINKLKIKCTISKYAIPKYTILNYPIAVNSRLMTTYAKQRHSHITPTAPVSRKRYTYHRKGIHIKN